MSMCHFVCDKRHSVATARAALSWMADGWQVRRPRFSLWWVNRAIPDLREYCLHNSCAQPSNRVIRCVAVAMCLLLLIHLICIMCSTFFLNVHHAVYRLCNSRRIVFIRTTHREESMDRPERSCLHDNNYNGYRY